MTKEYKEIEVGKIKEHPDNPRLFYRDDVIDSVVRGIKLKGKDALAQDKALKVAPRNGEYTIYGGHHRFRGAKKADLKTIYCWVDNDITDEEMFIELLEDNNQAELTPLERGRHAFVHAKKYSHDSESVSKYAERIGGKRRRVGELRNAYEVYKSCSENACQHALLKLSAEHFRLIHSAPSDYWVQLVQSTIDNHWTTSEIEENVKGIKSIKKDLQNFWLPIDELVTEFLNSMMGSRWIEHKKGLLEFVEKKKKGLREEIEYKEKGKTLVYKPRERFLEEIQREKPEKKQDIDEIYRKILKEQKEKEKLELVHLQEWDKLKERIHNIDILKYTTEDKFDTVVADFPYYISKDVIYGRNDTADVSLNFGEWDNFKSKEDYLDHCKKWLEKINEVTKKDASLYVFCSWFYISFIRGLIDAIPNWGTVNCIVWHKVNPSPSFREFGYMHSTEFCIYAKKGKPVFNFLSETERMHDFYESGLVSGGERLRDKMGEKIHSSQKPIELISQFLDDSMNPGSRVLDAFSGTGTTAIVAYRGGYDWEAVEIDKKLCEVIEERLYGEWENK